MSDEIIKVFDYIANKFGIVIDWSQENLVPYLTDLWNRFITYELVINILIIGIAIILLVISYKIILKYLKALNLYKEGKADGFFYKVENSAFYNYEKIAPSTNIGVTFVIITFMLIIGSTLFFTSLFDIVELLILPEKFALELINSY